MNMFIQFIHSWTHPKTSFWIGASESLVRPVLWCCHCHKALFRVICRVWNASQLCGEYFKNIQKPWSKDAVMKQPVCINGESPAFFFLAHHGLSQQNVGAFSMMSEAEAKMSNVKSWGFQQKAGLHRGWNEMMKMKKHITFCLLCYAVISFWSDFVSFDCSIQYNYAALCVLGSNLLLWLQKAAGQLPCNFGPTSQCAVRLLPIRFWVNSNRSMRCLPKWPKSFNPCNRRTQIVVFSWNFALPLTKITPWT